jgi:hypothetical protein
MPPETFSAGIATAYQVLMAALDAFNIPDSSSLSDRDTICIDGVYDIMTILNITKLQP